MADADLLDGTDEVRSGYVENFFGFFAIFTYFSVHLWTDVEPLPLPLDFIVRSVGLVYIA